jgi:hypothetical protein
MKRALLSLVVASLVCLPAAAQKHHYSHKASSAKPGYGEKTSGQSASSTIPGAHRSSANKELARTEAQSTRLLAGSTQTSKASTPKVPVTASRPARADRNQPMNFQYRGPKTHTTSNASGGKRGRKMR